ncbi:ABC-type bacteriocin/lantibiotic exporter with N-terminal double-glycine peptidase domain [SAR116 cluster alpha proteobacterium HIMB100]|nr:ABC-type bacteriocin/lantibiotic exporter with N-terminal double-glycine peptidase domain [SAR116 cluster alpha proteobacterium HIMB100]
MSFLEYIRLILNLSSVSKANVTFLLVLTLLMTVVELFSIGLLIPIFSIVLADGDTPNSGPLDFIFDLSWLEINTWSLEQIIGVAFMALLLKTVFAVFLSFWQTKLSNNVTVMLRSRIIEKFFESAYSEYSKNKRSDFIFLTNDLNNNFIRIFGSLLKTFSDVILFVVFVSFLGVIDLPMLLGLSSILVAWLFLNNKIFGNILRKLGSEINQLSSSLINLISLSFDGFKQIHLLRSESWLKDKIFNISQTISKRNITHSIISNIQLQSLELVSGFLVLALIYWVAISSLPPELAVAKVGVFGFTLFRLRPIAAQFNKTFADYRYHQNSIMLLSKAVSTPDSSNASSPRKQLEYNSEFNFETFELRDMSFSHSSNEQPIFNAATLNFKKGQFIGINGPSGAGKSTLLDIICGLLSPQSGTFCINGNLSKRDCEQFFLSIGYVTQQSFIFRGTLAENLLMGLEYNEENLSKINPALEKVGLDEFKNRFDLAIGEKGAGISGGQQQRLAIARMFVQNKNILILDEATNALDSKTESHIFEGLKKNAADFSVIFVSHDAKTLKFADLVYSIKNGKIQKQNQ